MIKKILLGTGVLVSAATPIAAVISCSSSAKKETAKASPTTETKVPTTETKVPTTETKVPTTETKVPTTETKVPTAETKVPTAETKVPTTETKVPTPETKVPATETKVPTTETKVPATETTPQVVKTPSAKAPLAETKVPVVKVPTFVNPERIVAPIVHKHYPIAHLYRLDQQNSPNKKFVEEIDDKYTTVDLISKPDSITLPSAILFSDKTGASNNISNLLKLTEHDLDVDYIFNKDFKITIDNSNWAFDADGELIKKDDKAANITIEYKGLTTTTKAYYGSLDSVKMKNGELTNLVNVSTPSTWGTTTTITKDKTPDGIDALKVHMVDVQEASGGLKAYGQMTGIDDITKNPKQIHLTPYANYIAIKVYVSKEMLNTPIWFRSSWRNAAGTANAIEFSSQSTVFEKEGWYLIQTKINKALKWDGDFRLKYLKFIQMSSQGESKSGDLYLENIYESFDRMTSIHEGPDVPKENMIYFEI